MTTSEAVKRGRRNQVLEGLRTPKTIYTLSNEIGVPHYTLRLIVLELEQEGLIQQTNWTDSRKKVYVSVTKEHDDGVVWIAEPGGAAWPLGDYVGRSGDPYPTRVNEAGKLIQYSTAMEKVNVGWHNHVSNIDGALAQAYMQSLYKEELDKHIEDGEKAGAMSLQDCRSAMREELNWLEGMRTVVEQLILAPIWDSPTKVNARKFGKLLLNEMATSLIARQFEKRHGYG